MHYAWCATTVTATCCYCYCRCYYSCFSVFICLTLFRCESKLRQTDKSFFLPFHYVALCCTAWRCKFTHPRFKSKFSAHFAQWFLYACRISVLLTCCHACVGVAACDILDQCNLLGAFKICDKRKIWKMRVLGTNGTLHQMFHYSNNINTVFILNIKFRSFHKHLWKIVFGFSLLILIKGKFRSWYGLLR